MNSCSLFQKSQKLSTSDQFLKSVKRFCFNGDGKGRINLKANKYLFRYESLLELTKNSWKLAFDIPVHGEELIELMWEDNELRVNGKFYGRLLNSTRSMKNGRYHRFLLKRFLRFLVDFSMLTDLDKKAIECGGDSCHALGKDWSWSQKDSIFTVTQTLNDRHRLIAKGFSTGKDYFGKLTFSVEDTENSGGPSSALALSLFATSCDP